MSRPFVIKSNGESVSYSREKLIRSLRRSGADDAITTQIISEVESSLHEGITTQEIYDKAFELLHDSEKVTADRYKLKRAILELGPSGFPFEKFIAALLQHKGFRVTTGIIVQGKCVTHEIDVIALLGDEENIIECKFHNVRGMLCDVKVPLYIHSRFQDVNAFRKSKDTELVKRKGWLVTNTHFTPDALQYGRCTGLRLVGWNYPENEGLRDLIDEGGLYPLTCLSTITNTEKQFLLNEGIVLCKQLTSAQDLLHKAGISETRINKIMQEVMKLCGNERK